MLNHRGMFGRRVWGALNVSPESFIDYLDPGVKGQSGNHEIWQIF